MRNVSARAWALLFFSALLQVFMFPTGGPAGTWRPMLCWVALVPFLVALALPGKDGLALRPSLTARLGYFCGLLWYLGNCFWIYQTMYLYGGLPKPVSFVILILFSLYLGLYHGLFGLFFSLIHRSKLSLRGALLLTPAMWVAVELARARITGFPWDLLGYAQVDNMLVTRIAPLAGVMGISFLIAAVNAGFASFAAASGRARRIAPTIALLVVILVIAGRNTRSRTAESTTALAVLMQENLAVGASSQGDHPTAVTDEVSKFSSESLMPRSVDTMSGIRFFDDAASITDKVKVVVWPEAPAHFQSDDPVFRVQLGDLARAAHAPVIAGSLGVDRTTEAARGYYLYDSASIFSADGSYAGRYDKIHLVPWGEYVPFKEFFAFAQKLTEGVGDMDRGRDRNVFQLGGHAYGVFICYESIFGDEVREFAKNGAEVLVNISDDGWYGDSGAPWQHLNMARMRAIENHRWVLRSTNTGVTTAIDPSGRVAIEAPRHVRGAFAFPFAFEQGTTFYTRHGDWFAWLCAAFTAAALAFTRIAVKSSHA